jgi:hypothetical protein
MFYCDRSIISTVKVHEQVLELFVCTVSNAKNIYEGGEIDENIRSNSNYVLSF